MLNTDEHFDPNLVFRGKVASCVEALNFRIFKGLLLFSFTSFAIFFSLNKL
jgi:hypothetical protein